MKQFTKEEAAALGYKIIAATPFEVGLLKNGKDEPTAFMVRIALEAPV